MNMLRVCKVKTGNGRITQKANVWQSLTTITRANNHLAYLAKQGKAFLLRQEENRLMVSVPQENAIYTLHLRVDGCIEKIVRF